MRRCFALSLLLVAAFARIGVAGAAAEAPTPAVDGGTVEPEDVTPTFQLVQVWPKTKQALMFDPIHGTYVVVSTGQMVDGFRVARIGKRQITLAEIVAEGPGREFVLLPTPIDPSDAVTPPPVTLPSAVTTPPNAPSTATVPPVSTVPPATASTATVPPGATPPTATAQPAVTLAAPAVPTILDPYPSDVLDPYGHDGFRVVQAPIDQRMTAGVVIPVPVTTAPGVTPVAPTGSKPSSSAPIAPIPTIVPTPTATIPAKSPPTPTRPSTPPSTSASSDHVVLSRRELDAALGDFARLTHDSQLALGTGGVSFTKVAAASLFARVGLRDGDRINAINGVLIRSIDDAAGLYARLGTLDHLSLDVVRGTARLVLRCDLTR